MILNVIYEMFSNLGIYTQEAKVMFRELVVFASVVALALASDVLEFKDSDFEEKVKGHEVLLVEFFAPW
ncbi:unnamed protein product, partial [Anisakis simplex]|uniref:Cytochrome P450 n=1 Tax=Anisakis simplex TaxID=6269 RepID=A0A0M3KK18_ANISI